MDPTERLQRAQDRLNEVTAPFVRRLGMRVVSIEGERVTLELPVSADLVHIGGVVCGQSVLAAADTAMVVALLALQDEFRPMTTVQLQTSFLRPIPANTTSLAIVCTVLRRGRTLAFGDIQVNTPDGRLAAHATTTYAFL